jgi:murein DD-endopeptidase MepM/ murein hydrolase activator NlpD
MLESLDRTWLDEGGDVIQNKRLRLVFFNTRASELRQWEVGWGRVLVGFGLGTVMLVAVGLGAFQASRTVFEKREVQALVDENQFLKKQLKGMYGRLADVDEQLRQLEKENETLQIIAGLPPEENEDGTDGNEFYSAPPVTDAVLDVTQEAAYMSRLVDGLEQRIRFASNTHNLLETRFLENKKKILHTPSIRPVFGGRVTDKYGNRLDPFIGRLRHHDGIDIAAPRGTEVYASASGVVELARQRYRINEGFGRVVIINHGGGVKTLYGHLSKIFVRPGQRVSRWEVIGLSGETGRATGPHLHYEIWVRGKPQDPEEFILN